MGMKRYFASADNTITNAFEKNLSTRGTGSNMGSSDILETFVIHGQTTASISAANAEEARILIQFPVNEISNDKDNGVIPSSSVKYVFKLYNAPHADTTPRNFSLDVKAISREWSEGTGLDMDEYQDMGTSNWISASSTAGWENQGGDVHASPSYTASFNSGLEHIEVDITTLVDQWVNNTKNNYGILIKHLDASISGTNGSLFTKKFFGRSTQYFNFRPTIEARWNSSRKDNRRNFILSSSLLSEEDNINTLYFYNRVRGQLKNIPSVGDGAIYVSVFTASNSSGVPQGEPINIINQSPDASPLDTVATGGLLVENGVSITGVYTCSFACTDTTATLYDVWFQNDTYHTGSFSPVSATGSSFDKIETYRTKISNLKASYTRKEKPRLRLFTREKNWNPNIYTKVVAEKIPEVIEDAYYSVYRLTDKMSVIPFGTGSVDTANEHTKLSYDVSGNYFDLDMSMLEEDYGYGIQIAYYLQGEYKIQPEVFKFRIERNKE
tara:strand:+ start:747 stop:2237 length:1491 start_codon:yes stop_codon:yes gene_type:complete